MFSYQLRFCIEFQANLSRSVLLIDVAKMEVEILGENIKERIVPDKKYLVAKFNPDDIRWVF